MTAREQLLGRLSKLLPSQLEELVLRASIPLEYLPGHAASLMERVVAVVRYMEQQGDVDQLAELVEVMSQGHRHEPRLVMATAKLRGPSARLVTRTRKHWLYLRVQHVLTVVALAGFAAAGLHGARSCGSMAATRAAPGTDPASGRRAEPSRPPPGMVWIPPAEVVLGSAEADIRAVRQRCAEVAGQDLCERLDRIGYWDREPQRRVQVLGFWIDREEVTVASFITWLRGQPAVQTHSAAIELGGEIVAGLGELVERDGAGLRARVGFEDVPMIDVSWQGAVRYCAARGARLPSGDEWERAARGDGARFPWGGDPPTCRDAVLSRLDGRCPGPGHPELAGRGERDRTREGVLDLVGNVSEWVYGPGLEPATHEVRGGSYGASWVLARPAGRMFQSGRPLDVGFRCAAWPEASNHGTRP